jgi:glycosyltransferase involved in cell wall biosynthesis
MRKLFVAWVPFQRRSVSLKSYFGYDLEFLSFAFKNRLLRPLEYILKAWKMLVLFLRQRPQVIWIQLPPTPPLHLAHLYKTLFSQQVTIIADCHNATFRRPWIRIPGTVTLLNRCDLLLVHNDWVKKQAVELGITHEHLYVLEDPIPLVEDRTVQAQNVFPHPWILCPCSFNKDEPIQAVIESARLVPEITFVLTGNTTRAKGIHDLNDIPPNVKLAGFLPTAEFDSFLCNTDVVLGLTKLEGVQLSVANEAVGVGKPMVLSNTELLQRLFYKGAVYVDSVNPESIAQGCKEALLRKNELAKEVSELKEERSKGWQEQVDKVAAALRDVLDSKLPS